MYVFDVRSCLPHSSSFLGLCAQLLARFQSWCPQQSDSSQHQYSHGWLTSTFLTGLLPD